MIATRVTHGFSGIPSGHFCTAAIVVHEPTGQTFCASDLNGLNMDEDEWAEFSGGLRRIDGQDVCTVYGCWEADFGYEAGSLRGLCDGHCEAVVNDSRADGGYDG